MSSSQEHRLFRLRLDYSVDGNEQVNPLQERLSHLINQVLVPLMDRLFSEYVEADTRFRLDRLELDLGIVMIEELERELPVRLEVELSRQLHRLFRVPPAGAVVLDQEPVRGNPIEALLVYLQKGAYPWWLPLRERLIPKALLDQILKDHPIVFKQELRQVGHAEVVSYRMALVFSENQLYTVTRLLLPAQFNFIYRFSEDLKKEQEKAPLFLTDSQSYKSTKWELILSYFLVERGSVFNRRSFVKHTLTGLSNMFGVNYEHLILRLSGLVSQGLHAIAASDSLAFILLDLKEEVLRDNTTEQVRSQDFLLSFLRDGETPLPSLQQLGTKSWNTVLWKQWLQAPEQVFRWLETLYNAGISGRDYLSGTSPQIMNAILAVRLPHVWKVLQELQKDLRVVVKGENFPGVTGPHIDKTFAMICWEYLTGSAAPWYDPPTLLEVILQKLAPPTQSPGRQWWKNLAKQLSSTGKTGQLSSSTQKYLLLLLQERGIHPEPISLAGQESPAGSLPQLPIKISPEEAKRKIIKDFISQGSLPPGVSISAVQGSVRAWLSGAPESFRQWLQAQLQHRAFTRNLLSSLPEDQQFECLDLLAPPAGQYIRVLCKQLLRKNSHFRKYNITRSLVLQAAWKAYMQEGTLGFRMPAFVMKTLHLLAERLPMPSLELLSLLENTGTLEEEGQAGQILNGILAGERWGRYFSGNTKYCHLNKASLGQLTDLAVILDCIQSKDIRQLIARHMADDRGSLSNQKNFLSNLLTGLAASRGIPLESILQELLPVVSQLGPVLRNGSSLEMLRQMIFAGLPVQTDPPTEPTESPLATPPFQKSKPYRKLWDQEQLTPNFIESWLVPNAGLVLLWPYFGMLFERAGLMGNGEFPDDQARQTAVYLLEFLVQGEWVLHEHLLTLNKVLCGIPVNQPMGSAVQFPEEWEALCEGLLSAVIEYWSALQDTSVEALRETFLFREGHMGRTNKGWYLQVPQRGYDILLSQLPWGIAAVNLSWLDHRIEVQWA